MKDTSVNEIIKDQDKRDWWQLWNSFAYFPKPPLSLSQLELYRQSGKEKQHETGEPQSNNALPLRVTCTHIVLLGPGFQRKPPPFL